MTGTDFMCLHIKSVPVIFEPPCTWEQPYIKILFRKKLRTD